MKKLFLMLVIASCFCLQLHAQVAPVKSEVSIKNIVAKLQTLSADRIIENAYLHFDKPYYDPGDTLYFKAYVTAGERHELSKISGVLHVDLISKNDSVMQSILLHLDNGMAAGDFALPAYMSKGNYRVRAYTQWMQNSGETYFFDKTIPVTGRGLSKINTTVNTDTKVDVQFFPEGGSFVTDVPSKIAFKAVGSDGLGVYVKGTVIDNLNKEVTKFTSAHLGMGQFFITPDSGKTYRAKITYPDGSLKIINLPKPLAKGITLLVNNDNPDKLSVEINANRGYYLQNKNKEINVLIYSGGSVRTVKTVLDNQVLGFDLPKKDMRSGVVQVTLFAQDGTPLCERLAFVQNTDILNLTVNTDKAVYTRNEKAHISLNAKGAGDKQNTGYFSVSVVDDNKVQADDDMERTILSDLLLTSELKGYIEQPGYYFSQAKDAGAHLDMLMLTQGFRRFVWNDILNTTPAPIAYQPENMLQLTGLMQTKDGKPVANEKVTLILAQTGQSLTAVTNNEGKFKFEGLEFTDKTKFIVKAENPARIAKTQMVIDNGYTSLPVTANNLPVIKPNENLLVNNDQPEMADADQENTGKVTQAVVKETAPRYRSSSLAGSSSADQVIGRKDFISAATLSEVLRSKARGIKFENGVPYLANSLIVSNGAAVLKPMLVVVDGEIGPANIDNYNPTDVESVEILKGANAGIYGMNGGTGVMIINTRRGGDNNDDGKKIGPGVLSIAPQGFYKAREFYSPRYDVVQNQANPNNYHTTVLWKPNVVTDKAGNASFDYTNIGPGTYRLVVEGIDEAGNLGRAVLKYKVQ